MEPKRGDSTRRKWDNWEGVHTRLQVRALVCCLGGPGASRPFGIGDNDTGGGGGGSIMIDKVFTGVGPGIFGWYFRMT